MYETERRMFEANAKCLLQSGTTDAVLDVSIDPITGKVGVVQTDDEVLFDGLVIDEEPALPSGAANWEHVVRYGGDRLVLTNANLYADIAAKDIREELEELRGKVSALPKGPDLSRAKAWGFIDMPSSILSSYNVKNVSSFATGRCLIEFEVPFKNTNYVVVGSNGNASGSGTDQRIVGVEGSNRNLGSFIMQSHKDVSGTMTLFDDDFYFVVYGELENE